MGVHGLWDLLRPAAAATSLSTLSRDAFLSNKNGLRALTVGIDASIWIFHAQVVLQGENPFLRTIFMKITALLRHPVIPVFVFDGPNKPNVKRNQRVTGNFGTHDNRSRQFKALLDSCGLEWWNAPGEAEAELAVMNRQGKIDAILSDDADALLFGATCLLRNPSATLSGAQASKTNQGNASSSHQRQYEVYTSSAIKHMWSAKEGTQLKTEEDCRLAMVLVALLSGGDYTPEGTFSIGPTISHGLASAGISSKLNDYIHNKSSFQDALPDIQLEIIQELRTNATKQVGRRYPDRANKISAITPEELFPPATLEAYLNPCTSPRDDKSKGWPGFGQGSASGIRGKGRNEGRGDMEGFASACENYFEWGTKDLVCKKFGGESLGVFGSQIMNSAREAVRARDAFKRANGSNETPTRLTSYFQQSVPGSSSRSKGGETSQSVPPSQPPSRNPPPHILAIHSAHPDPTNKNLFEYRISFHHAALAERCTEAMIGTRMDPGQLPEEERERLGLVGRKEQDEEGLPATQGAAAAKTETRVWVPEYLVKEAWPGMVQEYEDKLAAKNKPKKKGKAVPPKKVVEKEKPKPKSKKVVLEANEEDTGAFTSFFSSQPIPPSDPVQEDEDWDALFRMSDEEPVVNRPAVVPKRAQVVGEVINLCLSPSPPPVPTAESKKRLARSPLASSQSSALSGGEKSESSVRTVRRARKKRSPVPASPSRSSPVPTSADQTLPTASNAPRFSARQWGQKAVSSPAVFTARPAASLGVIDLCNTSSDEDEVVPPPRRRAVRASKGLAAESGVLTSSQRPNAPSPRMTRSSSVSLPAAEKSTTRPPKMAKGGSILNHPLFSAVSVMSPPPPSPAGKGQTQASSESTSGLGSPKAKGKERSGSPTLHPRRPMYRMISETEEGEVIDCTRRRRS
ncbi:hypothetical protein L198_02327 [Cryptococcus wingfieldii CBS 7118]|uniref:XPG-I domain-containing protein n=1 Tax=Cryptococcus wingfieldii CBS 7118 TaxID=1295528 RepID=A0A1E3JRI6_9TREE|nr:hypothetical protein L198_02327 [Cryptococcus wingfieldii CBS 7118]ODO03480.1 hypothetical protein L198_02327 [Cryptococcus wingfieldii CBS 7118]